MLDLDVLEAGRPGALLAQTSRTAMLTVCIGQVPSKMTRGGAMRLLVVDDQRDIRDTLAAFLQGEGYAVTLAASADEALAKIDAEPFDVVLADIKLDGMDGLELCQRISASRPDVPVVMITAFASMDNAVAAMRAGAFDFVTKPIDV